MMLLIPEPELEPARLLVGRYYLLCTYLPSSFDAFCIRIRIHTLFVLFLSFAPVVVSVGC